MLAFTGNLFYAIHLPRLLRCLDLNKIWSGCSVWPLPILNKIWPGCSSSYEHGLHSSVDSANNCSVSPQFTLSTSLQDSMMLNHPSMMDLQDTWSLLLWVCLTYDLNSVSGWLQFWSAQIYIHIFLVSPLSGWFRFFLLFGVLGFCYHFGTSTAKDFPISLLFGVLGFCYHFVTSTAKDFIPDSQLCYEVFGSSDAIKSLPLAALGDVISGQEWVLDWFC